MSRRGGVCEPGLGSAPPEAQGEPARTNLPQINAIRLLALCAIFLHHAWKGIPHPGPSGALEGALGVVFEYGSLGVVFFNMISGLVLALPYLGPDKKTPPGPGRFLKRRFLRLLPQYYMALIIFSAANVAVFGQSAAACFAMFVKHVLFSQSFQYSMLMSNFAAYWYLGMLAQLYLLFLPTLSLFRRIGPGWAFLVVCGICWGGSEILSLYVQAHPDSALGMADYLLYFNAPSRLPEFAAGMWLAAAWRPEASGGRGLPVDRIFLRFLNGAVFLAITGAPFHSGMTPPLKTIYEAAWCLLAFVTLFSAPFTASLGRTRIIAALSAASYSIYLVHQPLLSYVDKWISGIAPPLAELGPLVLIVGPAATALALLLDRLASRLMKTKAA